MGLEISDLDMELAGTTLVPDLRKCAILLDIDGTILDLAPSPQQVWVPTGLRQTLARLGTLTGGALALVSGRSLHDIDLIFSPLELAAIGGHGAELRATAGAEPLMRAKPLGAALKRKLASITELGPGILAEDKGYSLALHFRLAPEKGEAVRAAVDAICAGLAPDFVEILPGKLVVEIKPTGVNKANAVCELMNCAPFVDRNPIFIGDDTTDEPVFGVISRFGGLGFSVGRVVAGVNGHFDKPEIGPRVADAYCESGGRRGVMNEHGLDFAVIGQSRTAARRPEPRGMIDHGLDLAVIGNGRTAALVDPCARIVWWCYPRFDGDPIFCRLVSGKEEKGFSDVVLDDMADFQSQYVRNTAIVSTELTDSRGGKVRITDFAPRFRQFGRVFRPPQLYRIVEPIAGLPRIAIRMRPTCDYGKPLPSRSLGSNHIRYSDDATVIRLTTDAPLSLVDGEAPFVLTRPLHLVFGPDEPFTGDLEKTCRDFLERTHDYWMEWVRRLSISYDWQEAIIRAAITLKLSNFDETGGIIAAHTTSIPESPSSGRTWDYRYCWLRDAYFVVQALNRIGATRTMEEFISFTLSIASNPNQELRPLYSVVPTTAIEERTAPALEGYRGDGPVRIGNAAVNQVQHDAYGSVILAAMPMFFDRRLPRPGDEGLFRLLESLGNRAAAKAFEPDAGIWEYRGRQRIHTHSAAMCWAGCQRLAAIAVRLGLEPRAKYWNSIAEPLHAALLENAWNQKRGAFTAAFGSDDLDASVLLLADLGVVEVDDPRFASTVAAMERELVREKHVMRYASADDFGMPVTAFLICRFWLIDALWSLGRREAARDLFTDALQHRNRYGLLSEDVDPQTGALWGNFPQTYSMAGLILSAMRLSRSWEDRYWRG